MSVTAYADSSLSRKHQLDQLKIAWVLTFCLFVVGLLFATGAGYVFARLSENLTISNRQVQAVEMLNGRWSRALAIIEDEGFNHKGETQ